MSDRRSIAMGVVFVVFIALLSGACNPWYFTMQRHSGWEIEGKIISNKEHVEIPTDNLLIVEAPAAVAIRCYQITDGLFDAEITLFNRGADSADDEVLFQFRSTPYEDTVLSRHDPEFRSGAFGITICNDYVSVRHQDSSHTWFGIVPNPGTPFRLRIVQHGRYANVEVACTNLGQYQMENASTQWLTIAPQGRQRVEVRDPVFRPLEETFPAPSAELINTLSN